MSLNRQSVALVMTATKKKNIYIYINAKYKNEPNTNRLGLDKINMQKHTKIKFKPTVI